jgi:hypothetical protein
MHKQQAGKAADGASLAHHDYAVVKIFLKLARQNSFS